MNLNRSSKVVFVLLVLAVATVGQAAAVSVSGENVPDSAKVGAQQDVTFTFTELYTDYDEWTLRGQTELQQVSWTVTAYGVTGQQIEQQTYTGANFSYQVSASDNAEKITVRLQGTTPEVEQYQYEPAQSVTFATFLQSQEGGSATVIKTWENVRPYTAESQQARDAIQAAEQAIADAKAAGADTSEAEVLLENAIDAYNHANFQNAVDLAKQAQQKAESAQQSNQLLQWALIGVGVLVLLLLIAGGIWYYRKNQGPSQPF